MPSHPNKAQLRLVDHYEKMSLWHLLNVPNSLTLARLCSIPVFLALLSKHQFTPALYVFAFAAATDALDGTVARLFDARTEIGAVLDPFADKLLLLSAFVALTIDAAIPGWLLGVVVIRDIVVVFGYLLMLFFSTERVPIQPSYMGKSATFFQLVCVVGALIRLNASQPEVWTLLLYLTVTMTAGSGLHYAYRGLLWLSSHEPEMFA